MDMSIEDVVLAVRAFFESSVQKNKKYKYSDIKKHVCGAGKAKPHQLCDALTILENEGYLYRDAVKGTYRLFPHEHGFAQGAIKINKHCEGFLETPDGLKFKVSEKDIAGVLDGDIVVLRSTGKISHGCILCKVDKIIQRNNGLVVVEVSSKNGEMVLTPFNAKLNYPIILNNSAMKPLVDGDRILVRIDKVTNDKYIGEFVKMIGHKDDPDAELKLIAIENGIAIDFTDEALAEADRIPTFVSKREREGRLDLRDEMIFTIDGSKTKDRDDAVSIRRLENGNYQVGVHIADVSHYIHPGMKLWDEAMSRSTSVYMLDTVIPMIPHKLSNGICSLNPGEDRLTLSCIMEVTPEGVVVNYDFVDCVINSRKAMTYDEVNSILEDDVVPPGYEEYADVLREMGLLSDALERQKIKRGYVNLGSSDLEIELDSERNPVSFNPRVQRKAEKLIENFMLIAGTAAAEYLAIPTPYRVHDIPEEEKVVEVFATMKKSGIKVKEVHEIINGKVIQQILAQIKDADLRDVAASLILRSMPRAQYSTYNVGHFGLGLYKYGQFTSPIRRAGDLRIHHNIRLQRDNLFDYSRYDEFEEEMMHFARHATYKEKKADTAEMDANKLEMVKYMSEHLGERFEVIVRYVNSQGIWVKTPDGIEGKVNPADLDGDTFIYDERTASYKGRKSKVRIKIGSRLVLTCIDTKREWKIVNFGLEYDDFKQLVKKK